MALTKHMTTGDVLRIRKLINAGVTDVKQIQEEGVLIHAHRIQEVIDVHPAHLEWAKNHASKEAAAAAAKKAQADGYAAPAAPVAPPPVKKQTAAQKAKAKAAAKASVDPLS